MDEKELHHGPRQSLGEMLMAEGLLTQKQLDIALREQRRSGDRLEKILVNLGFATEDVITQFSSKRFGIPYLDLDSIVLTADTVKMIPESLAVKYQLACIARDDNVLSVAMVDPLNVFAIDDIERATGLRIKTFISTGSGIRRVQEKSYGISESVEELLKTMDERSLQTIQGEEVQVDRLRKVAVETPIVTITNLLLTKAVREAASDIHFEPQADCLRVRMRIDGILYEESVLPKKLHPAIISRLKIMGEMDIGERRLPQDGHIGLSIENREVDLRLSSLPTIYGEKLVVRILDKRTFLLGLDEIGFSEQTAAVFNRLLKKPQGLILVTGPTGSGKTTTLYAALQKLNLPGKNINTVEDPVEYKIININQTQINPKAGMSFAKGLRGIMRQDPDVIMIGEIRDLETAEIAIRASLTGHLVLSTMHTNDAVGAVDRLLDMGCERYLIATALTGVLAQRLVRSLCEKCKKSFTPSPALLKELHIGSAKNQNLFEEAGCQACRHNGFQGRMAIFEMLNLEDDIRRMIIEKKSSPEIRERALSKGMGTLWEDGARKVLDGRTTIGEVMRVLGWED